MITFLKNSFVSILVALGIGGTLIVGGINGSVEPTLKRVTQKCYAAFANDSGQELVQEMECEKYHWLSEGSGDRRPDTPPGYSWKWSGADIVPEEGEYVLDRSHLYLGRKGEKPLKLDLKEYSADESGGLTVFPDPPGISISKGKLKNK